MTQHESQSDFQNVVDQANSLGHINDWLAELCPDQRHRIRHSIPCNSTTRQSGEKKRRREFKLGRACAESQLQLFGVRQTVGINPDRSPIWPIGFVGSISHSNHWTWATVARETDVLSVGIDTEVIVSEHLQNEVESEIASDEEWQIATQTGLDSTSLFTVVFSAKEAIFKCCFPLVREYFGFEQALIESADWNHIQFRLNESNPAFAILPTNRFEVYFQTTEQDVFTLTWLEPRNQA